MNPTNPDLVRFLLDRIAEDRLAAIGSAPGPWSVVDDRGPDGIAHCLYFQGGYYISETLINRPTAEHIARHHPIRIIAECDAKRRIVQECLALGEEVYNASSADVILAALALPYADHPGYRPEWRS